MRGHRQQGIQHARSSRLPRVHERERLKCCLCTCPPVSYVSTPCETYPLHMKCKCLHEMKCSSGFCWPLLLVRLLLMSCISGRMCAPDPRATNEPQVMALFLRRLESSNSIPGSRAPPNSQLPVYLQSYPSPSSTASGCLGRIGVIAIGFDFLSARYGPRSIFQNIHTSLRAR